MTIRTMRSVASVTTMLVLCAAATAGPPANDDCANAEPISGIGLFPFDNGVATMDGPSDPLCLNSGIDLIDSDVWFCWTSPCDANVVIDTCDVDGIDTKIAAYEGCGCGDQLGSILACNDDTCMSQSSIEFAAVAGAQYLIRVGTFIGSPGGAGELQIAVVDCPVGACCTVDGDCVSDVFEQPCVAAGGVFQGAGSECVEGSYQPLEACEGEFEDISATGTVALLASTGDDNGDIVPIGFTFNYFGDDHDMAGVSSNGYLTFNLTVLGDLFNSALPDPTVPNDMIAVCWDDWAPNMTGTVYYETRGVAPNRRFIVHWEAIENFGGAAGELGTFQVILHEGTNCFDLRYGTTFIDSPTIGFENQDGTIGECIDPATIVSGLCLQTCQELEDLIDCGGGCDGDTNSSGVVDTNDLVNVILDWGTDGAKNNGDVDGNGIVNSDDLVAVVLAWGPC
ncbi:MAG: hypothetical protein ACYTGC_08340 [Planctomycetota bacterium]